MPIGKIDPYNNVTLELLSSRYPKDLFIVVTVREGEQDGKQGYIVKEFANIDPVTTVQVLSGVISDILLKDHEENAEENANAKVEQAPRIQSFRPPKQ